jgi:hypothetical protein
MNCPHCGKGLSLVKAEPKVSNQDVLAPDNLVDPGKLVTCNRCGECNLAWAKSKKGSFYLCRTEKDECGAIFALRREFHKCQ